MTSPAQRLLHPFLALTMMLSVQIAFAEETKPRDNNGSSNSNSSSSGSTSLTRKPSTTERANRRTKTKGTKPGEVSTKGEGKTKGVAEPGKGGEAATKSTGGKKSSGGGGGAKSVSSLGTYNVKIDQNASALILSSENNDNTVDLTTPLGGEFTTALTFDNRELKPFDEISLLLSYDFEFIEPVAILDSALAPLIDGQPDAEIDPAHGLMTYKAKMKEPYGTNMSPFLRVRWKAKKLSRGTPITIVLNDQAFGLHNKGVDVIGNSAESDDGVLGMTVTVVPVGRREAAAFLSDTSLYTSTEKVGGVTLKLRPPLELPTVGKPFAVDVVLDNESYSRIDDLSLLIDFDPKVLTILDADQDNLITRGTNILDGPFRKDFTWDFHLDNEVFQNRGMIRYRVGAGKSDMAGGKNTTVARIYAVASEPTAGTVLQFKFIKDVRAHGTAVTYMGRDCLGDAEKFADGVQGVQIQVMPRTESDIAEAPTKRTRTSR